MSVEMKHEREDAADLMEGTFLSREQRVVELLRLTLREGAAESERIEQERTKAAEESARWFSREVSRVREEREDAVGGIEEKRERSLAKSTERFEKAFGDAERAHGSRRVSLIESLNKAAVQSDEKLREQMWIADTVLDGAEKKARQVHARVKVACEQVRKQATEIEAIALRVSQGQYRAAAEAEGEAAGDVEELLTAAEEHVQAARAGLEGVQRAKVLWAARGMLFVLPLVMIGGAVGGVFGAGALGLSPVVSALVVAGAAGVLFGGLMVPMWMAGVKQLRNRSEPVARHVLMARAAAGDAENKSEARMEQEVGTNVRKRSEEVKAAQAAHKQAVTEVERRRVREVREIDEQHAGIVEEMRSKLDVEQKRINAEADELAGKAERAFAERMRGLESEKRGRDEEIAERASGARLAMERLWAGRMERIRVSVEDMNDRAAALFPAWSSAMWQDAYHAPAAAAPAIRFGTLEVEASACEGGVPADEALRATAVERLRLPAMLDFPGSCSLLIETGPKHREQGIATLGNVMLRLLTSIPPGKLRFTIVDPVGLGQSFAGFMHLADFDEALVSNRIWTDPKHVEKKLTDLTEHMEKVIQKYLRNEFESIEAYNRSAGEIAEPYRFLVIADFPEAFTDAAAQRLKSVIESGARCGVYTLILTDAAKKLPSGLTLGDLERHAVVLTETEAGLRVAREGLSGLRLELEAMPGDEFVSRLVRQVGELSKDAGRVEVPFGKITPKPEGMWSESSAREVRVPLGRAGATKLQYLALGRGTSQHVLIAGKTGSGKSTLLHVLVSAMAMWYSPREVEFYLVDFKKGVEFKTYATHRLAHARAVAVESDREFGLSVLQKLDQELKRRGDLYREVGAQDVAGLRERRPDVHLPRTLLIIDEFQEFFVEDDKIAQDAALLLDRLVRQGRAFGMHVLLGSQTLSGAYSLARSTVGQMAVRIALQCSETDSYLILSEDNAAARLLARPGEAIYNDANGMIEGNSPFQIAWLPDSVRDEALEHVRRRVETEKYEAPEPAIVFEGNVPSKIEENHELRRLLERRVDAMPAAARAWFGDPVAIKEPTAAVFRRQTGANCVMVGQQDDEALALSTCALMALGAQYPRKAAEFVVLDGTPTDDPRCGVLGAAAGALPQVCKVGSWRDAEGLIDEVAREVATREEQNLTDEHATFVFIHGLHRFRTLRRKEDDYSFGGDGDEKPSADKQLAKILREGPAVGVHAFVWCDTVGNLERALDRQSIGEFEYRVLFQMNANDSTVLIDSPAAGRLGQSRGLLYSEDTGSFEKFRPYGQPGEEWLSRVREALGGGRGV